MAGFEERFPAPDQFRDASDELHALVGLQLGTDDFGPGDYLPGLEMLLQSMDVDPHFTERGRRIAWGDLVNVLGARAHAWRAMKINPGFDRHPVSRPIVITGVPRTGTTALHKLMAVDPQFQGLQTWLTGAPMPRPPRDQWSQHPQFLKVAEQLRARYDAAPDSRAAHLMVAEEVDECCLVLRQSFVSNLWTCGWSAHSYDAWWQQQSERPAYRHLARVLQLIGSAEPDKRWLLKNPGHIANLDLVFETFPDALVIQTHRDSAKALPSLCALLMQRFPLMEEGSRPKRARAMLTRETEKWADAVHKAEAVRHQHPGRIFDVVHADFHRDPMGIIRRIYSFAGLELTPEVDADMVRRAEERPELAHGVHRYDLADFGMGEEAIRAPFGDYIDRFGLAPGKSAAA
ncbi:sulfotransferase family protein [Sphingomonas cavernae]|uniref:Sulfotransferase n=1 Tax=Sphingomonas cavernae TaxID=2320861 RepID=A0A418WKM9_9SPHN|nr:sulfotransferase [Sphingomonas cavernae]RJF90607.1 sulfotransferase [Sphingomonas cavernae]